MNNNRYTTKDSFQDMANSLTRLKSDTYDDRADVHSFIKKLRVDDCFRITNETKGPVDLKLTFESKKVIAFQEENISIEGLGSYFYDEFKGGRLSDILITTTEGEIKVYLNPEISDEGFLHVRIQEMPDRLFLYKKFYDFSFIPKNLDQNIENEENPERIQFLKDFKASRDYLNYIAHQEGLGGIDFIDEQRDRLYAKNNMPALLRAVPHLFDSAVHKIPLITHKIWVTSDDSPTDPSDQYIRWLENSIEHNKVSQGWTHYFWIENKEKQSRLYDKLIGHPSIKVMELDGLSFETGNLYKKIIQQKPIGFSGQASDILRIELLKQFGGFYLDTDYEVFQSLIPYSKVYDLIVGLDPMSPFLGNAFIATKSDHPFLEKALELIKRNFSQEAPDYVKREFELKNEYITVVITGPIMITVAVTSTAGQGENVDIILPPQLIYPAMADLYPMREVAIPDGRFPPQTIGAHYWNNAWVDLRRMPK